MPAFDARPATHRVQRLASKRPPFEARLELVNLKLSGRAAEGEQSDRDQNEGTSHPGFFGTPARRLKFGPVSSAGTGATTGGC